MFQGYFVPKEFRPLGILFPILYLHELSPGGSGIDERREAVIWHLCYADTQEAQAYPTQAKARYSYNMVTENTLCIFGLKQICLPIN